MRRLWCRLWGPSRSGKEKKSRSGKEKKRRREEKTRRREEKRRRGEERRRHEEKTRRREEDQPSDRPIKKKDLYIKIPIGVTPDKSR